MPLFGKGKKKSDGESKDGPGPLNLPGDGQEGDVGIVAQDLGDGGADLEKGEGAKVAADAADATAPSAGKPPADGEAPADGAGPADGVDPKVAHKGLKKKKSLKEKLSPYMPAKPWGGGEEESTLERQRTWELSFACKSFENVTATTMSVFFSVSLGSENPKRHRSRVKILPKYTNVYTLAKNEPEVPDNPIILFDRKWFKLSYAELAKHIIKVDYWRMSCWTFNEWYGETSKSLQKIAWSSASNALMIKRKQTRKQREDKKSKKPADVALFACTINLEEVFDFQLWCDNWTFELMEGHKEAEKRKDENKRLRFIMPTNKKSLPARGTGVKFKTTEWNPVPQKFFWQKVDVFRFTGTQTHLQTSYFIVEVYSWKAPGFLVNQPSAQTEPRFGAALGKALMGLTSVLDISVFNGVVKQFVQQEKDYIIGLLSGNVKCVLKSKGFKDVEISIPGGRPMQPKTAASVSHLNSKEKHLIVRVAKCENLAVADADTNSSDPYLKAKWDNMAQESPVLQQTCRPVFQHSFFFPVRVVFDKILRNQKYETNILQFELKSKGSITLQVWDDDKTSADFLGGFQLGVSEILVTKNKQMRTMLGKIKKIKDTGEEPNEFAHIRPKQWYEEEHETRIYDGLKSELQGCTIPQSVSPLIHFEAYFFPDWPSTLKLKDEGSAGGDESVWVKKAKEFMAENTDFSANQYAITFPDSIGAKKCEAEPANRSAQLRRFNCTVMHPVAMDYIPMMALLVPIIIPQEFSNQQTLLHWMNCISFSVTAKQLKSGLLPEQGWKSPDSFLAARKGPPQDHAILLCSLLLGCKKDAFVVKGTIYTREKPVTFGEEATESLVEHVWVMTREEKGWVTFWEPCTRQCFHLEGRWIMPTTDGKKKEEKEGRRRQKGEEIAPSGR